MKKFAPRRTLRTLMDALEPRRLLSFSALTPIQDTTIVPGNTPPASISLAGRYADTNTLVDLHFSTNDPTSTGDVVIELTDAATPATVANFLNYVNSHRYDNTIIHRLVPGFVMQGGGFTGADFNSLTHITTDAPVVNEFSPSRSNLVGTIAMAKAGGDPNSATSEWFINLADNSSNLDNQNGGFTTFGNVVAGMSLVNYIAANVPYYNGGDPFSNIPLVNFVNDHTPTTADFVNLSTVSVANNVTYSITGNTNPSFVTPSLAGSTLSFAYGASFGSSTITITATDAIGRTVNNTFKLVVPQFSVAVGGTTVNDNQSTPISYGAASQTAPATKTFHLVNGGATTLTFSSVSVPAGFVIQSPSGALPNVAAGDSLDIVLATSTTAHGAIVGNLVLNSNDPAIAAFDIPVAAQVDFREAAVTYNSTALTSGQSSAVNFGTSSAASFTVTLTVKNNGSGLALNLTAPTLPAGYTILTPLPSSLAPGASANLVLSINTTTVGTKAGTIAINSDDPVTPAFSFPVTALVSHGIISVAQLDSVYTTATDPGGHVAADQSFPVNYGFVDQNSGTPNSKTFRITNTGNAPLVFSTISEPAGFFVTDPARTFHAGSASTPPNLGTLAIGASIDITITQRADTGGDKSGTLTLNSNDPNAAAFAIPLAGFTHYRKLAVSFASVDLVANGTTHATPAVDFGTGVQGSNFQVTFHVTNTGDTLALTLAAPTLPAGFSVVTALPATLAPGDSADLVLAIDTSIPGTISDTIVFNSGDPLYTFNPAGFRVPFTANITFRHLAVTDASDNAVANNAGIPFGTILQGDTSFATFHLANTGNIPLILANPVLPTGFALVGTFPTSIAAGGSADITLALDSLGRGDYAGAFTFTTNDVENPSYTLNLSGKVLAKGIVVSLDGTTLTYGAAATDDFGKVRRGTTGPQSTFTVLNSGALPLAIQSVELPAGYTLVQGLPDTLAPGASAQLVVALDTTNPGYFNGTLHIVSSDPDRPSFDVPLTAAVSLPVKVGTGGARSVTFTDADGTASTFTLTGPGSATLDFYGNNLKAITNAKTKAVTVAGSSVTLGLLTTTGTAGGKSKLTVTSKGGNKSFDLVAATGSALLSFSAPNAKLTGIFHLKTFSLAVAAAANATITLPAGVKIAIPTLTNTTIATPGNIKSILVTKWNAGTLTASSVDSLTAAGAINGLTISAKAIGTLVFKAAFTNSAIVAKGQVKSVTTKTFNHSSITGKAMTILSLGNLKSKNGGIPFGITAASITNLTAKLDTGKSLKLTGVNNKKKLATQLAVQKVALNDFRITLP